ncbi:site-specific recombinase, partial [Escherichia coli]|uniref:site-specific recombinase n=1 Tax=Escherichia coli TaxID=562 RepID=UPI001EDB6AB1
ADTRNLDEINKKFDAFVQSLLITPNAAYTLQAFLLHLIQQYKQSGLYSDSGILSQDGFWNQLSQRMGAYVLPSLIDHKDLRTLIGQVFHQKSDRYWLDAIEDARWNKLFQVLGQSNGNVDCKRVVHDAM